GGCPNDNTAEGDSALFSLTTGASNSAIGNSALFSNTTGSGNTAVGFLTLPKRVRGLISMIVITNRCPPQAKKRLRRFQIRLTAPSLDKITPASQDSSHRLEPPIQVQQSLSTFHRHAQRNARVACRFCSHHVELAT